MASVEEVFVGYKLTKESREKLLKLLPPKYQNVVAHHITTDFLGDHSNRQNFPRNPGFLPPAPQKVEVIGHAHDEERGIHAAVVRVDDRETQGMDPDRRLHVTISHGEKAKPRHANDAIKKGWTPLEKPISLDVEPMSEDHDGDVPVHGGIESGHFVQGTGKLSPAGILKSIPESSVSEIVAVLLSESPLPNDIRAAPKDTSQKLAGALRAGLENRPSQRLKQYDATIRGVERHIGQRAYLVGGAVRDAHIGRENKDVDLVTIGGREKLENLGYKPIKGDFPVYTHPKFPGVEVALARGEKKSGEGHTGFQWYEAHDLHTDLTRRDLTANAMAYHPDHGIVDPHGGASDLKKGVLRHVGEHFSEDPLRTFRVARFAAQMPNLKVHQSLTGMMKSTGPELSTLPADRVKEEMGKALSAPNPRAYFDTLHNAGVLHHWHPEVAALKGKKSSLPHSGDAYDHTMDALASASKHGASSTTKQLLLTQQMAPEHIRFHARRFIFSKPNTAKLLNHSEHHTTPFRGGLGTDNTISYWSRISSSNLRDHHLEATVHNQTVSNIESDLPKQQTSFNQLDSVKFTSDDFKKRKGSDVRDFKMSRWRSALATESVAQLVTYLVEGGALFPHLMESGTSALAGSR